MRKYLFLIPIVFGFTANNAYAGTCEEAVQYFADQHRLSVTAPAAALKGNQVTIPNTAETDGLIRPPKMDEKAIITPPEIGAKMPTTPKIAPDQNTTQKPTPGQRARAEALLLAARAAGREGDEEACYAKLNQAQQVLTPRLPEQRG